MAMEQHEDIQRLIQGIKQENEQALVKHKQELEGQLLSAIRQIHSEAKQAEAPAPVQSVGKGA